MHDWNNNNIIFTRNEMCSIDIRKIDAWMNLQLKIQLPQIKNSFLGS